ncbi:MAG: sigma-70 family RNA polymerase sigma factor, partial [Thermoleophilia bacterium]|nr:sigma-70 family RNA polymerase sigma factor [Thermoleophilia bacterium]
MRLWGWGPPRDRPRQPDRAAPAALLRRGPSRARRRRPTPERHAGGARGPPGRARRGARARGWSRRRDDRGARRRRDARGQARTVRARDAPRRSPAVARAGARAAAGPRLHRRRCGARVDPGRRLGAPQESGRLVAGADDKLLLRRYHEHGDLAAREQLIEQYMSLVRSLARRYSYRGEQLEDLVQIGAIGLIKAIDRFDLSRGVELTTYATPNIIGEIKRHFRDKGWSVRVPRGLQELSVQLSRIVEQLTVQLGRSPTIAELAKEAGVDEEAVLEALESGRAYSSVSLSAPAGG